jgi:GNAT superfamily N-acetyltransferase
MPDRTELDHIAIGPARPEEAEALLQLFVDVFHNREPLTTAVGFSRRRMLELGRSVYLGPGREALEKGLWWMARDSSRGDALAGFAVCNDLAADVHQQVPRDMTAEEADRVAAFVALQQELHRPLAERFDFAPGHCLHISALGVAPAYEGRGLATRLLSAVLDRARAAGFQSAVAECTGPASRKCHEKCGFASLHRVRPCEFDLQGTRPFADITDDYHLMFRHLP